MLTKILITALVILGCYTFLRFQRNKQLTQPQGKAVPAIDHRPARTSVKWLSVALLALSLTAVTGFFIHNWLDNRQLLSVKIINPYNGETMIYQVYKGDLEDRRFKTVDGQTVRVSNSERMEIHRLEQ